MSAGAKSEPEKVIQLKDPILAAFLAWLIPGLGHLYQGRTAKAVLFFVCLMGTFVYGCYLGSNKEVGPARVVYLAWNDEDMRLPYLCQAGMGLPALPALIQANRARNNRTPNWGGFMAPPRPVDAMDPTAGALRDQPSLDDLNFRLREYFELGTVYTMIAGLLNILVIYDAWGGPVFPEEKEDDEDDSEAKEEEPAAAGK